MNAAATITDFEARDHVHSVVEASGTSFLQGMRLLPEDRREQAQVRRLPTSRRSRRDEIDDIFADDEPISASRTRVLRPVGNGDSDVQVHLVIPRNFNDAQQVADQFKR